MRRRAVALILAAAIGAVVGAAVVALVDVGADGSSQASGGLRVNGSDVGATVWEIRARPSAAPQCTSSTKDGIGRWTCNIIYARGDQGAGGIGPVSQAEHMHPSTARVSGKTETFQLTVDRRGAIVGSSNLGAAVDACCIAVQ